jgi:hypothetical protein
MAAKEMEKFIVFKIGFQLHRLAAPLPGLLLLIFLRRPPGAPIIRITPIARITPIGGLPMAAASWLTGRLLNIITLFARPLILTVFDNPRRRNSAAFITSGERIRHG